MQLSKNRIASAVLLVSICGLFCCLTGCVSQSTNEETNKKLDEISAKIDKVQESVSTMSTAPTTKGGKHAKIPMAAKPGRAGVTICMNTKVDWEKNDAVIFIIKRTTSGGQIKIETFKFMKGDNSRYSHNYNDKGKHEIAISVIWLKPGDTVPDDVCTVGPNCSLVEGDAEPCTDVQTTVATVKTTSGGTSTATVTIDEQ